jgi:hypothetical protein
MPPRNERTPLQRQHTAFMSKAMAAAPKNLKQTDKMRWAAQAWSRQRGQGLSHPGFSAVAKHIARKKHVPVEEANAILASSSRRASAKAKAKNPNLRRVKGKGIGSLLLKAAPYALKAAQVAAKVAGRVVRDHNSTAADVLDILGGMGTKPKRLLLAEQAKRKYRTNKLQTMRRQQGTVTSLRPK